MVNLLPNTSNSKEHIKSNINQKKFYSRQFFGMSTSLFGEPTPANQGFEARGGGVGNNRFSMLISRGKGGGADWNSY
jgi:hypothetical protein